MRSADLSDQVFSSSQEQGYRISVVAGGNRSRQVICDVESERILIAFRATGELSQVRAT
jgi:hypothetical protein